jgi:hypothetical protein
MHLGSIVRIAGFQTASIDIGPLKLQAGSCKVCIDHQAVLLINAKQKSRNFISCGYILASIKLGIA